VKYEELFHFLWRKDLILDIFPKEQFLDVLPFAADVFRSVGNGIEILLLCIEDVNGRTPSPNCEYESESGSNFEVKNRMRLEFIFLAGYYLKL